MLVTTTWEVHCTRLQFPWMLNTVWDAREDLLSTCIVVVPSGLASPPPEHTCNLCQMPGLSGGLQVGSVKDGGGGGGGGVMIIHW